MATDLNEFDTFKDFPVININNYSEQDVVALNDWAIQAQDYIDAIKDGKLVHRESYEQGYDDGWEDAGDSSHMLGLALILGASSLIAGLIGLWFGYLLFGAAA